MKLKILLMFALSVLFLQNCAPIKIASVASSGQKRGHDDSITSEKKHVVSLYHYTKIRMAKDQTIFMVTIQNGGEAPINFRNDNISVIFEGESEDWASKRIKIQSIDDFIKDLERNYMDDELRKIEKLIRKTEDTLRQLVECEEYEEQKKKEIVSKYEFEFYTSLKKIQNMRKEIAEVKDSVSEIMVKPQAIMPDSSYSGILVCDTQDMDSKITGTFRIVVSIDGEDHILNFKRS